jgi:phosphomannomutase/phosphoglucomutase
MRWAGGARHKAEICLRSTATATAAAWWTTGRRIFADKIGVLLARDMSSRQPGAKFVVDVKSTGIYNRSGTEKTAPPWITGGRPFHMKRRTFELRRARPGRKGGHYFPGSPADAWL